MFSFCIMTKIYFEHLKLSYYSTTHYLYLSSYQNIYDWDLKRWIINKLLPLLLCDKNEIKRVTTNWREQLRNLPKSSVQCCAAAAFNSDTSDLSMSPYSDSSDLSDSFGFLVAVQLFSSMNDWSSIHFFIYSIIIKLFDVSICV